MIKQKPHVNIIRSYIAENAYYPRMLFVGLLTWISLGIYFARDFSLLSGIDLIFHEAGHVIFYPFGQTLQLLGGSLMQILVPSALLYYFAYRTRDYYGAAVMLWWLGENLTNISIYMGDAQMRSLALLGGGDHDWFLLFNMWGLLPYTELISDLFWHLGIMVLLTGIMWGLMSSHKSVTSKR